MSFNIPFAEMQQMKLEHETRAQIERAKSDALIAVDLLAQRVNKLESQIELLVKMIAEMSKHG